MAIASIIVSVAGIVLSYALFFPLSLLVGPFIGLVMGIIGLILALVAHKRKKSKAAVAGIIIGAIVTGLCVLRTASLVSCIGCIGNLISGAAAS
ncbi:hypothetical protein LJC56_10575 [Christensenellaceae bacterium OttesenSCG-928-K19]|nr:hypothetical protein [Christensenellaceae bacterium OttesenSCG-928-K19]